MNDTVIYLIRHAETVEENGIRNTNENSQMCSVTIDVKQKNIEKK